MPSSPLASHPVFNQIDLNKIATDTHLVQRKSKKFDPSCFVLALLEAVITGNASLSQISKGLGNLTGCTMARQALHNRFSDASSDFLFSLTNALVSRDFCCRVKQLKHSFFNRILLEDSCRSRIHRGNTHHFPGWGNGKVKTSEFKVDLSYDLLTGELESNTYHDATEQDKSIGGELIENIRSGDLILRDMGYTAIAQFARIEEVDAFWLSRLPVHIKVTVMQENSESSLEDILKNAGPHKRRIDARIKLGKAGHSCRLVALRAKKSVVKERRRDRIENGSEATSKVGLIRDGWHILITNIDRDICDVNLLMKIYRMRWDIEIQFRAWKQSLRMHQALDRDSSPHHIYALIQASMIHLILAMMARKLAQQQLEPGELSVEKLLLSLSQFILKATSFERCWDFASDLRHVRKDRRKRAIPLTIGFQALG